MNLNIYIIKYFINRTLYSHNQIIYLKLCLISIIFDILKITFKYCQYTCPL